MAKIDPAATTQKMHALLKNATPAERQMIVAATLTLFGESFAAAPAAGASSSTAIPAAGSGHSTTDGIRAFFDAKQPKTKIEQLAVAARYREEHGSTAHTKQDFKAAFSSAKRPFDAKSFSRDMGNAKTAKLFNTGTDNQLSYYGEQYVDALPDHKAAAAIKRPGQVKKKKKKKAGKKA